MLALHPEKWCSTAAAGQSDSSLGAVKRFVKSVCLDVKYVFE